MTTRKSIFLLFIAVASLSCYCQTTPLSKQTDALVKKIAKTNELMGSAVGYSGTRPKQFDNFSELRSKASNGELQALTDHKNAVVRCYAFWALSYDSAANLFPIIVKHINDNETVRTQFGCIGSQEKVGDFFISVVTPNYVDLSSKKLDSLELVKLDSILIYSTNELSARSQAIARAPQSKNLYPVIRKMVLENKNPSAIISLAKYRNKQDIPLILKSGFRDEPGVNYYYTYKAIREFPDSVFIPFLESQMEKTFPETHYGNEWREMYKAIAGFRNIKAFQMLNRPLTEAREPNIRKYHLMFVYEALQDNLIPLYDDLVWKLWEQENHICVETYKYLLARDPVKTLVLTKKTLNSQAALNNVCRSFNFDIEMRRNELIILMLNETLRQDHELGIEIIRKNILEMNVNLFPVAADKAAELKAKNFIEPLFQRLETESNPHVYLKTVETLIQYNDPEINNRILATRKKNSHLSEGWGSQSLDRLLDENGVR